MSEYGSAFFRKKQLELEDKMDLASYLLKPVQRMGKYALILKQVSHMVLLIHWAKHGNFVLDLLGSERYHCVVIFIS